MRKNREVHHERRIHKYAVGHRINRQLLLSLEDVFKQYNKK